jgi:hypothetical protein
MRALSMNFVVFASSDLRFFGVPPLERIVRKPVIHWLAPNSLRFFPWRL